jgi:DNA repair exonuclease SbcCD ATPase subunit
MPTKAQLESEIQDLRSMILDRDAKLSEKSESLNKLHNELQRSKNDADRQLANYREADMKLKSICRVIASTLAVKYETEPSDAFDTPNKDRHPEEVRFLRHLFELADTSVPF